MNMHAKIAAPDPGILRPTQAAFELESHVFGIMSRAMRKASSNGQGIIVAEDDAGRVFKLEISQVAGPV